MYYPKSKIIENLYTNGEFLYYKSTGKTYKGYYHKLFNGKIFSGKNPDDKPVEELELYVNNQINTDDVDAVFSENNLIYNYLKNININKKLILPKFYYPLPKEEDYNKGFLIRYFVKKINENYLLEINQEDYNAIKNKDKQYLYYIFLPFEIKWFLTGDIEYVINQNILQIEDIEQKIKLLLKITLKINLINIIKRCRLYL